MDCIFCKIIKGEIPCRKLYEDEHSIAFLDIFPAGYGHSLVVPKNHCATLLEAAPEALAQTMQACRLVADALVRALDADGFNIFQNNREAAGQVVHHLHFHILPRFTDDGLHIALPAQKYSDAQFAELQAKVAPRVNIPGRDEFLSHLREAAADNKLSCSRAFELARRYGVPRRELGHILNQQKIKLCNCQFGCF